MPIPIRFLALLFISCGAVMTPAGAQNTAPAGVVLQISGSSRPPLAMRQEVSAGARITLAPGTRLTLLHYSGCTIVTVVGGAVAVTDAGVEADAGSVESRKRGPCPRVHLLSLEGARPSSGALVMRGVPPSVQLSPHLDATLAGGKAMEVSSAEVLDMQHAVVLPAWPVNDASVTSNEAIPAGRRYVLRLHLKTGTQPVDVQFTVSKETPPGSSVLRLE